MCCQVSLVAVKKENTGARQTIVCSKRSDDGQAMCASASTDSQGYGKCKRLKTKKGYRTHKSIQNIRKPMRNVRVCYEKIRSNTLKGIAWKHRRVFRNDSFLIAFCPSFADVLARFLESVSLVFDRFGVLSILRPELIENVADIVFDTDRSALNFFRAVCLRKVHTGISGHWVLAGHFPKGIFYNNGRVVANA